MSTDTIYKGMKWHTELIRQAMADCQDPAHYAIFEKGLDSSTRIADQARTGCLSAQEYPGGILKFLEDADNANLAGSLAVGYGTIARASAIHAEKMNERKQRPELREAIIAVLRDDNGPAVAEDAWKKAGLILGKVNAWLKKHGHRPTTRKGVYDQINRLYFPRNVDTFPGT